MSEDIIARIDQASFPCHADRHDSPQKSGDGPAGSRSLRQYWQPIFQVPLELIDPAEEIDCPRGWLQRWCDRMRGRHR